MLEHEEQRSAWRALHHVRDLRHNGDTAAAVLVAEEALDHLANGGQMPPEDFAEFHVELMAERAAALGEIAQKRSRVRERRRPRPFPLRPAPARLRPLLLAITLVVTGWTVGRILAFWIQLGR
ncbi:hypothetical protein [Streptomyces sp. NPDC048350]|uniref:hypothetical protein n=1 Tax=Streptomyces sp. NPDC048350 TaxID=3365538 RepID=UPI00371AF858